MLQDKIRIKD